MKLRKDTVNLADLKHHEGQHVAVNAWVANKRSSKVVAFIIARDGSGYAQCVVGNEEAGEELYDKAKRINLESSVCIEGKVVKDDNQIGGYEIHVSNFFIYQEAEDYPLGKKAHGVDFLMDNRHLWLRSSRQWAVMRIRNQIIHAVHGFFQERGFAKMDSPIFTGNAAEGTTDLFETEFFEEPAYLAQTGQLYGEAMAMAMGKIYTFGPTFRAEKSKTRRHLSEFWMIEPEMAFYDLDMTMDLVEDFIRSIVTSVLDNCQFELNQLGRDVETLKKVQNPFPRITYEEAVSILKGEKQINGQNALTMIEQDLEETKKRKQEVEADIEEKEGQLNAGGLKKGKVNYLQEQVQELKQTLYDLEENERNLPQWLESARNFEFGEDFGGSDETVLTRLFETPVQVYNWPKAIKAFYMKEVDGHPDFVKGVDVLAPEGYGEIVGGSEREDDKDKLIDAIKRHNLPQDAFEWYIDLRRYGSVPHSGFGLGLARFVTWICQLRHVRESIPFPRMMGRLFP